MARRRRQASEEEAHSGAAGMERWLLTYADMITLLLALFVILFAMSTISINKFHQLSEGFHNAFASAQTLNANNGKGLLHQSNLVSHPGVAHPPREASTARVQPASSVPPSVTPASTPGAKPAAAQPLSVIQQQLDQALAAKGLANDVQIVRENRGLVLRMLADRTYYATDSAALSAVGNLVVDTVASVLLTDANKVVVEGYTDSQPIYGGPFTTNWELSAFRALNVVLRLDKIDHLAEGRVAGAFYGKTRPVVPNTTPANMALNRRVDFVILAPGQGRTP